MSRLYELTQDFEALYDQLDALDAESEGYEELMTVFFDTLEGIEGEIDLEAEALAVFCKRLAADAAAMKNEETKLRARRSALENKAERIKKFLLVVLKRVHLKKAGGPKAMVSRSEGRESVTILDVRAVLDDAAYVKPRKWDENDIDKIAVKAALAAGKQVPGATLIRNPYITIK